jgi:hypothetical protein
MISNASSSGRSCASCTNIVGRVSRRLRRVIPASRCWPREFPASAARHSTPSARRALQVPPAEAFPDTQTTADRGLGDHRVFSAGVTAPYFGGDVRSPNSCHREAPPRAKLVFLARSRGNSPPETAVWCGLTSFQPLWPWWGACCGPDGHRTNGKLSTQSNTTQHKLNSLLITDLPVWGRLSRLTLIAMSA